MSDTTDRAWERLKQWEATIPYMVKNADRAAFLAGAESERTPREAAYANLLAEHDRSLKAAHASWEEERELLMAIKAGYECESGCECVSCVAFEAHDEWLKGRSG